jgi:23S rRNA pseudouridine955/2504/2580 synthase
LNDNEGYGVSISKTEIKGKSVKIQTAYKTLGVDKYGNAILDINLLTGKKHQIRAHMAFYGHPLFGEQKYISRNMKQKGAHQALYAYKLIFNIENKNSILYYLHNKVIELDKKNIMKELEKI